MAKCEQCGAENNGFDECGHKTGFTTGVTGKLSRPFIAETTNSSVGDFENYSKKDNLVWPYLIAPLGAIALDYIIPIWSTWWISLILVISSFMLINTALNINNSKTSSGFKRFFLSLARSINAPRTIALLSKPGKAAQNILLWIIALTVSLLAVFSNVTTANANYLESRLQAEGLEITGQEFEISCPTGFTSGLPGSEIVCRAEIIFGLTIPVNIQINGPFEPYTWKAGW
jgi:hypothetical protein